MNQFVSRFVLTPCVSSPTSCFNHMLVSSKRRIVRVSGPPRKKKIIDAHKPLNRFIELISEASALSLESFPRAIVASKSASKYNNQTPTVFISPVVLFLRRCPKI
ncbi:hypothetical protein HYC85_009216 [Camellia sinensis]|uniref:Uncharacterized protein n=1 Tax=Camellia sinensis TaxID=4442 RepID=A0A7J7HED0_CAMSI|nr:hypothetical protein HYC85_009216 [Camellia sinensis]